MSGLQERALLVQLSISQWSARKFDRKVTKEVADSHGVSTAAGRYNKALLPMSNLLDAVHKKATQIRTDYYQQTLPWGIDGTQVLPTANYVRFMSEFRRLRNDWELLVNKFVSDYPRLKEQAKISLGPLFNDSDYPHPSEIRDKFRMDMAVFPMPTSDFRVSISSDELSRIQQDVEERVTAAQSQAMQEVWQRLFNKVQHMAEKLADPKAIFRDSMVENARELCELLPRLNFADDPKLEEMRQEVEVKLAKHHPDSLRNDPILRRDTAEEARRIMAQMGSWMNQGGDS
jgi:hypothetical protein